MSTLTQIRQRDDHSVLLLGPGGQASFSTPVDQPGPPSDGTGKPSISYNVVTSAIQVIPSPYPISSPLDLAVPSIIFRTSPRNEASYTKSSTETTPPTLSSALITPTKTVSRMITVQRSSPEANQTLGIMSTKADIFTTSQLITANINGTPPPSIAPSVSGTSTTKGLPSLGTPPVIIAITLACLVALATLATLLSWIARKQRGTSCTGLFRNGKPNKLDKWHINELTFAPSSEKSVCFPGRADPDRQGSHSHGQQLSHVHSGNGPYSSSTIMPSLENTRSVEYIHSRRNQEIDVKATQHTGLVDGPYPTARPLPAQLQDDDPFRQSPVSIQTAHQVPVAQGRFTVANLAPGDILDASRANSRLGYPSSPWMSPPSSVPLSQHPNLGHQFAPYILQTSGTRGVDFFEVEAKEPVLSGSYGGLPIPWAPLDIRPKLDKISIVPSSPSSNGRSTGMVYCPPTTVPQESLVTSVLECDQRTEAEWGTALTANLFSAFGAGNDVIGSAKKLNRGSRHPTIDLDVGFSQGQTFRLASWRDSLNSNSPALHGDPGAREMELYKLQDPPQRFSDSIPSHSMDQLRMLGSISMDTGHHTDSGTCNSSKQRTFQNTLDEIPRSGDRRQLLEVIQKQEQRHHRRVVGEISRSSSLYSSAGWTTDPSDEDKDGIDTTLILRR